MGESKLDISINAHDNASGIFKNIEGAVGGLSGGVGGLLGGITGLAGTFLSGGIFSMGMGFANSAINTLKDTAMSFFEEAMGGQEGISQLDAVLKSTGGSAGVTRDQVISLADALQQTTRFSDDQVISGENLLLTFTSIGKDVFPMATKTMLDMSQALGQDLKSSSIQLGKALQDPITGITALKRVGVNFTETQVDMIKNMMAHNDLIGAQKLILGELNNEFGGSAEAAGKTAAGMMDRINHAFDDMKKTLGNAMMPAVESVMRVITDKLLPAIAPMVETIAPILGKVSMMISDQLTGVITRASTVIPQVFNVIKDAMSGNMGGVGNLGTMIFGGNDIGKSIDSILSWIIQAMPVIRQFVGTFINLGEQGIKFVIDNFKNLSPILEWVKEFLTQFAANALPIATKEWGFFSEILKDIWSVIDKWVLPAFKSMSGFIEEKIFPVVKNLGGLFDNAKTSLQKLDFTSWQGFLTSIFGPDTAKTISNITDKITEFGQNIVTWIVDKAWPFLREFCTWFIGRLEKDLGPSFHSVMKGIQDVLNSVGEYWTKNGAQIGKFVGGTLVFLGLLVDWVSGIFLSTLSFVLGLVSGFFRLMSGDVSGAFTDVWNGWKNFIEGILGLCGTNLTDFSLMWWNIFLDIGAITYVFVHSIGDYFSGLWANMVGVGDNIVDGLRAGIYNAWDGFMNWLGGMIQSIPDLVTRLLGIHSPSTVFASIGQNMMAGMQQGLDAAGSLPEVSLKTNINSYVNSASSMGGANSYIPTKNSGGNTIVISPVIQSTFSLQSDAEAKRVIDTALRGLVREYKMTGVL